VDDATPRLLRALGEGLGWEAGEAWTLEPGARVLRWQAMWHLPGLDLVEFAASGRELTLAAGSGLPGRCLATGRPVWMPDVTRDPGFVRAASARRAGLRAAFAFPVLAGDECLGVLVFFSRAIREPDRELLQMVADVGAQIGQFTRRRMAEEALRRSEEQLRQAQRLDAIGRLTGGIAHDFSNLLSVILSYSEMLIERLDERDPARPTIVQVRKAALRAASLTRQLLAFARRQVLQPRVLDLNAVVVDVTTMLRRFIGENVRLVTRLAPDLGAVRMDPAQLGQVLMNLAINARDAMPSGGVLTIETANVRVGEEGPPARPGPGDWVMLAVSDTGHGMDAATRSRIFEPFFTTKAPGRGTGLGLSTVHGIVKQSGGEIDVESEPNRGAKFRIYLPRVAASPAAETEAVTAAAPLGDETILLVEDEEAVRDLARSILESAGYTVLAAAGGEAALDIARRHPGPIHVLLTDVVMPEMSGRELARRLGEERPGAKVLFMTGYGYEAVGPGGLLEEGAELMEKPFTPAVLLRRIAAVLRGGRRDDG
jgi:signal transduction histidine kinase